jgi:hypothetical protein
MVVGLYAVLLSTMAYSSWSSILWTPLLPQSRYIQNAAGLQTCTQHHKDNTVSSFPNGLTAGSSHCLCRLFRSSSDPWTGPIPLIDQRRKSIHKSPSLSSPPDLLYVQTDETAAVAQVYACLLCQSVSPSLSKTLESTCQNSILTRIGHATGQKQKAIPAAGSG